MTEPVISIIMPCYQNGATLEQTVRSVQRQTFENWELIAVNDGSTDDTGERLRALAREEPRMCVLEQENGGVSCARNAGLAAARGEWVFFADADDLLTADALCALLAMTDAQTDIVCGAYTMRYMDEGGREVLSACAEGDRQTVLESLLRGDSALNSMCARLYRRDMLVKNGIIAPPGVKVGEDVLFNLDAFMAARAWRTTRQAIYIYELGGDSAMTRARAGLYAASLPMLRGISRFVGKHHLETALFRAHIDAYLRTLRADRGRLRAALAFDRSIVRTVTAGVQPEGLCGKQRLYYHVLRLLPVSSILLP
ncbi:MAG: glycosyltransferase [Clostridiales bacterium]|nr:glycosyltransferase [Clostridiales bacterium]